MNIRTAYQKDYKGIAELIINELGYPNQKYEDIYKRLETIEESNIHQTLVACIDDAVVGFIGLCREATYEADEHVRVLTFVISEKYQRRGVGTALLIAAKAFAEENNIKLIKVSSAFHRTKSHFFYEANEFERVGFTFFRYL